MRVKGLMMHDLFVFGFFLQGSVSSANNTISYFCQEGQYNDMATLFFTSQESAIRHLFHLDGIRAIFLVAYFLPSLGNLFSGQSSSATQQRIQMSQ